MKPQSSLTNQAVKVPAERVTKGIRLLACRHFSTEEKMLIEIDRPRGKADALKRAGSAGRSAVSANWCPTGAAPNVRPASDLSITLRLSSVLNGTDRSRSLI
jgi:hypothetical protein